MISIPIFIPNALCTAAAYVTSYDVIRMYFLNTLLIIFFSYKILPYHVIVLTIYVQKGFPINYMATLYVASYMIKF